MWVRNFLRVTQLSARIVRWLLDFWKIYAPLELGVAVANVYFYIGMLNHSIRRICLKLHFFVIVYNIEFVLSPLVNK